MRRSRRGTVRPESALAKARPTPLERPDHAAATHGRRQLNNDDCLGTQGRTSRSASAISAWAGPETRDPFGQGCSSHRAPLSTDLLARRPTRNAAPSHFDDRLSPSTQGADVGVRSLARCIAAERWGKAGHHETVRFHCSDDVAGAHSHRIGARVVDTASRRARGATSGARGANDDLALDVRAQHLPQRGMPMKLGWWPSWE